MSQWPNTHQLSSPDSSSGPPVRPPTPMPTLGPRGAAARPRPQQSAWRPPMAAGGPSVGGQEGAAAVWAKVPPWMPSVLSTQHEWHCPLGARCIVVRELKETQSGSSGAGSGYDAGRGAAHSADALCDEILRENVIDCLGWMLDETLDKVLSGATAMAKRKGHTSLTVEDFEQYFALQLGIRPTAAAPAAPPVQSAPAAEPQNGDVLLQPQTAALVNGKQNPSPRAWQ